MKIVLGDIKYDVQFFKKEKNVKLFEVCQDKGDHLWRLGVYAGKDEKEAAEIAASENKQKETKAPIAIWINAKDKKIESVEINGIEDMQKCVEGYVEDVCAIARTKKLTTHLYANEEGRFKKFPYGFRFNNRLDIIGNGLIVGIGEEGDTESVEFSVKEVQSLFTFLDLSSVAIINPPPRIVFE
jgi:hypothetical protein